MVVRDPARHSDQRHRPLDRDAVGGGAPGGAEHLDPHAAPGLPGPPGRALPHLRRPGRSSRRLSTGSGSSSAASFDPFGGAPRLHGARRVGCRPGTELIHPVAVTGARPFTWQVDGLPDGLALDAEGVIEGMAPATPSTHAVRVRVGNSLGAIGETIELCLGEVLALTPPMGWNSWNVYGTEVTAAVVMRIAGAMVAMGLRDLGCNCVNIGDHWHAESGRGPDGRPRANPETFPDGIEAVADHVHSLGLKLGIYSGAAPDLWRVLRRVQATSSSTRRDPCRVVGRRPAQVRLLPCAD